MGSRLGFALGALAATSAFAQQYPVKPVLLIEPFGQGSGADFVGRIVAEKLAEIWGHPVSVENHTGGGGTAGSGLVAKAAPDGYTLLVSTSAHAYSAAFVKNLAYDPLNDFIPVAGLVNQPYVLVVGMSAGITSVGELRDAAKTKLGALKFGSAGTGTGTHVGAENFNLRAGIHAVHVPSTPAQATADLIAGRITYWLPPISLALPHVRDGSFVALAVSSARRSGLLPQVPTIAEAGVANFHDAIWYGIWAPAHTPESVVNKLAKGIAQALASPDVRERLAKQGAEPMSLTRSQFARFVRSETESAQRLVRSSGSEPR